METKSDITLIGLLGLLFVALKLCGVIDWSWWTVLLPFIPRIFFLLEGIVKLIIDIVNGKYWK